MDPPVETRVVPKTATLEVEANNASADVATQTKLKASPAKRSSQSPASSAASSAAASDDDSDEDEANVATRIAEVVSSLELDIERHLGKDDGKDMHSDLKEKIARLRNMSEKLKKIQESTEEETEEEKPKPPKARLWSVEAQKLSMESWQKQVAWGNSWPRPVMQAFYTGLDSGNTLIEKDSSDCLDFRQMPDRIVILSAFIKHELEEILATQLTVFPVVLVRPYKFAVPTLARLEASLAQLKLELEKMDEEEKKEDKEEKEEDGDTKGDTCKAASIADSNGTAESGEPRIIYRYDPTCDGSVRRFETHVRICHFETLRDFIKEDLADYLTLDTRILDTKVDTISFENLSYLFRPGDIIYHREFSGNEQLLTVYATTGGQPRRRTYDNNETRGIQMRQNTIRRKPPRPSTTSSSEICTSSSEDPVWGPVAQTPGIGTLTSFRIDCFSMAFDGVRVGPISRTRVINPFTGEQPITNLTVFPLRFHPDAEGIQKRLESRGQKFVNSYGHKSYSGPTFTISRRYSSRDLSSDIFVDFEAFFIKKPYKKPALGDLRKSAADASEKDEVVPTQAGHRKITLHEFNNAVTAAYMSAHDAFLQPVDIEKVRGDPRYLRLFPYQLPAWAFRTRRYVLVDVLKVADIDKSSEARDTGWDDLVIPASHRKMLIALVQNHATGGAAKLSLDGPRAAAEAEEAQQTQIEIVRGKGRGLIILLHGPPGSGKTSTAETIAAYTYRPLYSITCGDLGTSPQRVERRLLEHTDRAHRWGCVLLLDEADVFLTRRNWHDMERNALVSVFLRQMEYYSGILFLTTNRVGAIDEAFKSRIHVSLRYPRIGLRETLQIWENTLNRIERDNKAEAAAADGGKNQMATTTTTSTITKIKFDREALLGYAERHYRKNEEHESTWNGRQIRNAFQSAIALGRFDRDHEMRAAGIANPEAFLAELNSSIRVSSSSSSGGGIKDQDNDGDEADDDDEDAREERRRKRQRDARRWNRIKLSKQNFQNIANTATEFEEYLLSVHGNRDADMAEENNLRNDRSPHHHHHHQGHNHGHSHGSYGMTTTPTPVIRRKDYATPVSSSGGGGGRNRRRGRDGNSSNNMKKTARRGGNHDDDEEQEQEEQEDDLDEDLEDENFSGSD